MKNWPTLSCLVVALLLGQFSVPAHSQSFPTKTVKIVVPFPGGGGNDLLARIVAEKLQTMWGQPVVVENRTGAGGNIGAEAAARAEPDGHTLLVSAPGPLTVNQVLYRQLGYKPADFVPISVLAAVPNLIVLRTGIQVKTVPELVSYIKSRKVNVGSQGPGSTPHLTANMFMNMTGTQLAHIPYRGEGPVLNDMVGGHVDLFFGNVASVRPLYLDKKVNVLAVTDKTRAASMPDVPTAAEAGLPGFISTAWFAMVGPPNTPKEIQILISAAVVRALKMPDVQERYRAMGMEPVGNTAAEAGQFIAAENQRWSDVIRKNNITIEQ